MAKKQYQEQYEVDTTDVVGGDAALRSDLAKAYEESQAAIKYFSLDWDEYENILHVQGRTADNTRQRVSEGSLSAIVIERSARVVAQIPSGEVNALSIQDEGKSLLMDLLLNNYVYPNANEQYDFKTKLRLWDMLSNVYGTQAMLYDWCDKDNYTGPDCWLIPMRNFFPQQGRLSVSDCDFVFVSSFVSRETLEEICEDDKSSYDCDAIEQILNDTEHKAVKPKAEDDYLRKNPMYQQRRRATYTNTGQIEVVTKYEAGDDGHWISFCPDFANRVIRDIPNPHKSGKIPIVLKYALPLLDSIVGLGDMERGRYMQYAMDTTVNLQIDGQKIRTYPPIKIVKGNVTMPTIRFQPGAKWLVTNPNDVTHHELPSSEANLSQTYQFLKGALTNVTGSTTTQVSSESNSVVQGKTPAAIKAQQASESSRDEMDTELFELAFEELAEGFVNLINTQQDAPIELYMFGDEIKQIIAQGYDDVKDIVQYKGKKKGVEPQEAKNIFIKIKPDRLANEKGYRYKVDTGSSLSQDQEEQHEQLNTIMTTYVDNAQTIETLLQAGTQTVDFPELFKQWFITAGIKEWSSILKPMPQQAQGQPTQPGQPTGQVPGQPQPGAPVPGQEVPPQAPQAPIAPQPQAMPMIADPDIRQAHAAMMAGAGNGVGQ